MSKRKSIVDLHHGLNVPGQRATAASLQSRGRGLIHRKPGATNVRSTSSYKAVLSRTGSHVSSSLKPRVMGIETPKMPKTRFDSTSCSWYNRTPRLKSFPVESVRKIEACSSSFQPFSTGELDQSLSINAKTNTGGLEYGDTLELCPATDLLLKSQRNRLEEPIQQRANQVTTISQQHMPTVQNVSRINQSEAALNGGLIMPFPRQAHRPFVPIAANAISMRNSISEKSAMIPHSPMNLQPDQLVSQSVSAQIQQSRLPVCQNVSQNTREATIDQPTKKVPWITDDSTAISNYEVQPIGGKNTLIRELASSPDPKPNNQPQLAFVEQPATLGKESCDPLGKEQWKINPQLLHQQQHQNQVQNRIDNSNTMQSLQNAQQMYLQLQKNMIHQQKMQNRTLEQHQRMMAIPEQQMRHRPLDNQLKIASQQVYNGKPSQNIPNQQMFMQQQNLGHNSSYTGPRNGWLPNREVIHHSGVRSQFKPFAVDLISNQKEKGILSNDIKQYEQLKQPGTLCSQYDYPLVQHMPGGRLNPISYNGCISQEPKQQESILQSLGSVTHQYNQKQEPKQQEQQQNQTVKKKYPQFTAEMIRDQELLVSNMRQQKIPDNIMRRQFDMLLSEQRRHLELLGRRESTIMAANNIQSCRRSRALDEDQRPDWMGRITPARMQHSGNNFHQQVAKKSQEELRQAFLPEQMKKHDQKQGQMLQHVSGDSEYSMTPLQPLHDSNCQNNKQFGTHGLSVSAPYTAGVVQPQILLQPSWPQSYNQQNDFQNQLQWQQLLQSQYQQPRYLNETEKLYYTQQQRFGNCQQGKQMNYMISEEREKPETNISEKQQGTNLKQDEPWSLLRLKEFRNNIRPQRQNNGLQDAETVKAALEAFKVPEMKKGFEYVAEMGKKVGLLKLNGMEDPSEIEKMPPPPVEYLQRIQQQQQQPIISSNGLCNTRNANNPASPPISFSKKINPSSAVEYPRRCYPREKLHANMNKIIAEKENGSAAGIIEQRHPAAGTSFMGYDQATQNYFPIQRSGITFDEKNPIKSREIAPIMPYKFDESEVKYRQQMEQFYRNQLNFNKNTGYGNIAALTQAGNNMRNEIAKVSQDSDASEGNTFHPEALDDLKSNKDHIEAAQCLITQQADSGNNRGQPEIRERKIIGGITYLARNVDYIKNAPIFSPNTLLTSKYLQPSVI